MGKLPNPSKALLASALTLTLCTPGAAAAALTYRGVDLGVFAGDESSSASDINDRGDVVGTGARTDSLTQQILTRALIWRNGTLTELGTLPAPYDYGASASNINRSRSVVGTSKAADGTSHAFLWQAGAMTDLGTFGGPSSAAVAINNLDQIVGWAETKASYVLKGRRVYVRHAFVWQQGAMTDLGTLGCGVCPDHEFSSAVDINDSGEIVGFTSSANEVPISFRWSRGTMRPLTGLSSGDQVESGGINARGEVIGTDDSQSYTPILWRGDSAPTSLSGVCSGLGPGLAINNFGAVLSHAPSPATGYFAAQVCYRKTLTVLPPVGPSWADFFAAGMNNRGEVVGSGYLLTPSNTYQATHAVLWIPKLELSCD